MSGTLVGIGVGPGDPELLTIKAVHELRAADRVFVPHGGRAAAVVADYVPEERLEHVRFAMTDADGRPRAWDEAGERLAAIVRGGGRAAFATLGDPAVYSTFRYVAQTLTDLVPDAVVRTVPGITAMQDLAARSGLVLAEGTERIALVPWTAGEEALREELDRGGTVVVYKGGRELDRVLGCIRDAGRIDDAVLGTHVGTGSEVIEAASDAASKAPYLSTVVVPAARAGERGEKL